MLLRVSESLQRGLLEQPETGLRYQIAVVDSARHLILEAAIAVKVSPSDWVRLPPNENPVSMNQSAFSSTIGGVTRPAGWTGRISKC